MEEYRQQHCFLEKSNCPENKHENMHKSHYLHGIESQGGNSLCLIFLELINAQQQQYNLEKSFSLKQREREW